MKSYLDLVQLLARYHKRQNKMSIFCIILAVFLVTAIFGMADMSIRSQLMQARKEEGNWHVVFRNISEEQAKMIAVRPQVTASSWYGVLNYRGEQGYTLAGKKIIIGTSEESFLTKMQTDMIKSGNFPGNENEAIITENAKTTLNLKIGDCITIDKSDGSKIRFTVSGFLANVSNIMQNDSYGIFLTTNGFRSIYPGVTKEKPADYNSVYYVQFSEHCNIQKVIHDIKLSMMLSDKQVSENTKLLGLLGQSGNAFMLQIYGTAFVLFLLVMLAGIMMIASSLNSNIAQRTEFFGMLRCIGTTPKQVMKLVHKEALSWCKYAIPIGVAAGSVIIWILCAILRYLSPDYFGSMPVFAISLPSIAAGICAGILTVLLAARSPARRASKVSPLAAVSGNANYLRPVRRAANTLFFKIDTALGIQHAKSSNKNFFLMVASFSLSIILFLSFSVTIDFMKQSLRPLKPWTPDLSIVTADNSCSINSSLLDTLRGMPGIKRVYGRMFAYNVPVTVNGSDSKIDLISYEENQFQWAGKYLLEGSIKEIQEANNTGLIVFKQKNKIQAGDVLTLQTGRSTAVIKISGSLSSCPFESNPGVGTVICSEKTFRQLTGQTDYTIIDMQLYKNASEAYVEQIREIAGSQNIFSDRRLLNRSVRGSYYSFGLFIYGFMIMIAFITILNIVNSIAMSVSARQKQYGAFRAIGLSSRQLEKMIIAEAFSYAISGSICGSILGIILNKILYEKMITFHWGNQWNIPYVPLGIILVLVLLSVIFAAKEPIKRIRKMSIVDTISAQ